MDPPLGNKARHPGVEFMITIFGDFRQFSAIFANFGEKMPFFSKTNLVIHFLHYLALF
jgi:hypothetical protein